MNNEQFEASLREGEIYHGLRIDADVHAVIRVDGHGFSRFTAQNYQKPFDAAFHEAMVQTAHALLEQLGGIYTHTQSDEISVLLPRDWAMFDRSVEKTVSLSAGLASSTFSMGAGLAAHFDSRIWVGKTEEEVVDYFRWRQSDAARCALNNCCYWSLRGQNQSVRAATAALEGRSIDDKVLWLQQNGIDFQALPAWQRVGVGLDWETYQKTGFDPIKQQPVTAHRRRIRLLQELPLGDDYASFLRRCLEADQSTLGRSRDQ